MNLSFQFSFSEKDKHYLETSARLRNISCTSLMRHVMDTVLSDQLILAVLNDDDLPSIRTAIKHRGPGRPRKEDYVPQDKLYSCLKPSRMLARSAPMRKGPSPTFNFRTAKPPQTREQFEAELKQAVLNTGGTLVE